MTRNLLFPSLLLTLSVAGLIGTATASSPDLSGFTGEEVGYGDIRIDIDIDPYYDEIGRPASSGEIGNFPLGADGNGTAKNPAEAREQGVQWLVKVQHEDGGWGAGTWGTDTLASPSDVATTSYVTLALMRDANGKAKHTAAIERSVTFVVESVENAPSGAKLRTPEGTQPQYKLGQLVDTHFASLLFGEVIGSGQISPELEERVSLAYDMVLWKVQLAQKADGSFDDAGWAPVLSTSIASQGLYRAEMLGRDIDEEVLERSDAYQQTVAGSSGTVSTGEAAGVELYAVASGLRTNDQTAKREKRNGRGMGDRAQSAEDSAEATAARVSTNAAGLITGFGSIGGEEMLSYQMISDTLAENGGKPWTDWEGQIGGYLVGIQNGDGSWSGHHCITSTVFVTAGAVMTLSAEDYVSQRKARDAKAPRG